MTNELDRPAVPDALLVAGWALVPGLVALIWWIYQDAQRGVDTSYAVAHTSLLFWTFTMGSWGLAHIWLVVVVVAVLLRPRRRGWRSRPLQVEFASVAALTLLAHLLIGFLS